MLSVKIIILCNLIILLAFFLRSLAGFGGALIAIPLLTIFLDLNTVVVSESFFEVLVSILLLRSVISNIKWRILLPLILGAILGTWIGIQVLKTSSIYNLKFILGIVVVLSGIYTLISKQAVVTGLFWKRKEVGAVAGIAGGMLGGMFGISGPPFAFYLTNALNDKELIRASLMVLFLVDFGWRIIAYSFSGMISLEVMQLFALTLPGFLVGILCGKAVHRTISTQSYTSMVGVMIVFSGFTAIITSIR